MIDLGRVRLSGQGRMAADYHRVGETYTGRIATEFRGLHIVGISAESWTQDVLRIDGVIQGAASTNGLPNDWDALRLGLKTRDITANATAKPSQENVIVLDAQASAPIALLGINDRSAEAIQLTLQGSYDYSNDLINLVDCNIKTPYGNIKTSGSLAQPMGQRLAELQGEIEPNWARINGILETEIEPGAHVAGQMRPFRLSGPLSGGSALEIVRRIDAELALDLDTADAFGMKVGPTPIVVHTHAGRLTIEPLNTTLNGGRLILKPDVALDDSAGLAIRLGNDSSIENAEINDEVSRRVLAYVVPLLSEATQVRGRVSVSVERAEIPLGGNRSTTVLGQIVFQDVTFGPGPLTRELLAIAVPRESPDLRIHQPITLTVANGRVSQSGLSIPVNPKVHLDIDGSVGFDGTLACRAGVPVSKSMLGGERILGEIVEGSRIGIPIGGTLSHPRIDREAVRVALGDMRRALIRRGIGVGVKELLRDVEPPAEDAADVPNPRPDISDTIQEIGAGALNNLLKRGGPEPRKSNSPKRQNPQN